MTRWFVLLFLGLLVGSLVVLAAEHTGRGHTPSPASPELLAYEAQEPDGRVQGIRLVEQVEAAINWEVLADEAEWYATTQHAVVHRLQANFFQGENASLSVEADRGHIARTTGDISIYGHIRLHQHTGYTITTDELHWHAADRLLYTEAPVQIASATVRISGVGFRSHVEQRRFVLQRNVHASVRLD